MADGERRVPRKRRAVAMVAEAPPVRTAESLVCAACGAKDARIAQLEEQVASLLHHVERRG